MKTRDFSFNLPETSIAQHPPLSRGQSRLLVVRRNAAAIEHRNFGELPLLVNEGSVIVLNDSKVRKARVYGVSFDTGGRVEFLFTEKVDDTRWKAIVSKSKKQRQGKRFRFGSEILASIESDSGELKVVKFDTRIDESFFETLGHVPLPPYIRRPDDKDDESRYQTVFAQNTGSVAAPTAGLHFSEAIMDELKARDIAVVYITLHVGIGTFLPIRTENIEDHVMHAEEYSISAESARIINEARIAGKDIIAVGTTVVRTLESSFTAQGNVPGAGSTNLFIYPGYSFRAINGMLTNFHTPESSLLVLVSAFAGQSIIRKAYAEAIDAGYRFFSYGDAMLIL